MYKLCRFLLLVGVIVILLGTPAKSTNSAPACTSWVFESSMAGYLPGPGFYLRNDFYWYHQGNAQILPFSRSVEGNLGPMFLNLVTATYVTPLKFQEISYAAGMTWVAFGNNFIKGQVQVGNVFGATREGDYTGVGDLYPTPLILGWHSEYFHILGMTNVYTPVGS